ncbi:SGNH/GDSL hydrolase family protein [Fodinicola acaciae]|uniref:SGNH/GDSL hydrolase family protein n=1 Tax=Fodinicola acaciae TaxID=2681555 RepID=UPI0013D61826|nr:SGNH/GDSL hydrolase family protein [Fodinicola acaciae]
MKRYFSRLATVGASLLVAAALTSAAPAQAMSPWVGTWSASPQQAAGGPPGYPVAEALENVTVRLVVHPHTGGPAARIKLSNVFGDRPLVIGKATIATRSAGASIEARSVRALTFGGRTGVTIPTGRELVSDPAGFALRAEQDVAVDLYLPRSTGAPTWHAQAEQTSYVSTAGNHAGAATLPVGSAVTSWYFLTGLQVVKPLVDGVVAFGDSITDGYGSTVDANHRWSDYLATALAARHSRLAVINEGIGGGRVLHDIIGPSAISRFDRDVLSQPSAKYVVMMMGVNDIGLADFIGKPEQNVSAQQVIGGYRQLIARAHARGLKLYGSTITPIGGSFYDTALNEQKRDAVNAWIRATAGKPGGFDKLADFDAAIRDPATPDRVLPTYVSDDKLHPNDNGYAAMGKAAAALF